MGWGNPLQAPAVLVETTPGSPLTIDGTVGNRPGDQLSTSRPSELVTTLNVPLLAAGANSGPLNVANLPPGTRALTLIMEQGIGLMAVCFGHTSGVNYRAGRAPVPGTTLGGTGPGPQSFYVSLALDASYDLTFANDTGTGLGPTAVAVIAEFDPVVIALQPSSGHPFLTPDVSQALRTARADVPHFSVSGVFSANGTLIAAPGPNKYLKLYDASAGTGSAGVGNGTLTVAGGGVMWNANLAQQTKAEYDFGGLEMPNNTAVGVGWTAGTIAFNLAYDVVGQL